MSNLRVTAIVPLHNHEWWIGDAIDSLVAQDHPLRIVVVDDGSTDSSFNKIIGRLDTDAIGDYMDRPFVATGFVRDTSVPLTLLSLEKPHGPAFARNRGIEAAWADTDIFAFLDSDDLYAPTKVSRSVARIAADPGLVGAVYSDFDTLRPDGLRLRQWKPAYSRERLLKECIVNCDSLVSKAALAACGGFDETLRVCEDFDLWLRISERFVISHIPEALVTVRVGQHSSTSQVANPTWQRCYARVFEKAALRAAGKPE